MFRLIGFLYVTVFVVGPITAQEHVLTPPARGSSPWGKDDQRGAANRITPEKTLRALRLVRKGNVYSLGRVYEASMPMLGDRTYSLYIPQPNPPQGSNSLISHDEFVSSQIGQVGTQLDGLGHVGIGDIFYNGYDRREFAHSSGLTKLGVENVGVFATRGILLDIAALKGVAHLEKGYEITPDDLKAALEKQGVSIEEGDVVLIHTGWGNFWTADKERYCSGEPGIGLAAGQFLVDQGVVLVGADNWGIEVVPGSQRDLVFPVHQLFLTRNGIYNLENIDTSALARAKVYEFAFVFAPLRLKGAAGSPGNPIALN